MENWNSFAGDAQYIWGGIWMLDHQVWIWSLYLCQEFGKVEWSNVTARMVERSAEVMTDTGFVVGLLGYIMACWTLWSRGRWRCISVGSQLQRGRSTVFSDSWLA